MLYKTLKQQQNEIRKKLYDFIEELNNNLTFDDKKITISDYEDKWIIDLISWVEIILDEYVPPRERKVLNAKLKEILEETINENRDIET